MSNLTDLHEAEDERLDGVSLALAWLGILAASVFFWWVVAQFAWLTAGPAGTALVCIVPILVIAAVAAVASKNNPTW